jgi:hypothetical protein
MEWKCDEIIELRRELFYIVIRLYSKHIYPSEGVPHNQIDDLFD